MQCSSRDSHARTKDILRDSRCLKILGSSASPATLWPASLASTSIPRQRRPSVRFSPFPTHEPSHHQTSASRHAGRGPKHFPSTIQCIRPQSVKHGSDGHALADDELMMLRALRCTIFTTLPWPGRQRPCPFCTWCACAFCGFMLIMDPDS